MTLSPTLVELLARARADLRMGVPIVLTGAEPMLIAPIETLLASRFMALSKDRPEAALVLTARRAETLKARVYDRDLARILLPGDATLAWAQALANPARDLMQPLKGPLTCARGGEVNAHRLGLQLAKSARLLPAVLVAPLRAGENSELTTLPIADIGRILAEPSPQKEIASARLPIEVAEAGRLRVFRPDDGGEEHYALEIGQPDRAQPVLTRLHSACVTGDLLGSLKCDCGPQLRAALRAIGDEGNGVLLYLNQEGRGIGLANKMRAYSLQDQGFDTVEANHRLGFEDDERDFRIGSDILKAMGFTAARLLTNNPRKVTMLEANGISVTDRVPLKAGENRFNQAYLATKAKKSGHLL
ncbi:MAG: GTP cyclohydrolase II [Pseudomonadota bacterium]